MDGSRAMDLVIGSLAFIVFAPLMGLIALAIRTGSRGPILFRQRRLGQGGRAFNCLKFRTMRIDAEAVLAHVLETNPLARAEWDRTQKLRRDPRISRLGRFLRKTSLDELPQIFNVLAGDMSIVGPRPIVHEEAHRYRRYISSYYAVKPGITGLWQISGRNHTTYRRRIACDVRYVRTRSSYGDIAILAMTIPAVILGRGAY
jgi:lipopolysaccharide/colanic/teichoic acid biosynthesis glycosyltransferase